MKIEGVGNNVVIKRDVQEGVTSGGIILPASAIDKLRTGTIVGVGAKAADDYGLTIGERVVFRTYEGVDLELEKGKSLFFVDGKHIMARLS